MTPLEKLAWHKRKQQSRKMADTVVLSLVESVNDNGDSIVELVRHVHSEEGSRRYHLPIGAPLDGSTRHRLPGYRPRGRSAAPAHAVTDQPTALRNMLANKTISGKPLHPGGRSVLQPKSDLKSVSASLHPVGVSKIPKTGKVAKFNQIPLKGRKDGTGTLADPIDVGEDLDKAVQLLGEGKHIRLNQPMHAALLVDKLRAIVEDAQKSGNKAKSYDLCKVTVPGTNLFCVDEHTEIMTKEGWKFYNQISVGDIVLTLNHASGLSEWQPLKAISVWPVESRQMLKMEGQLHSSLTTLEHRWPVCKKNQLNNVRRWTTSEKLTWDDCIQVAAPCKDVPQVAKYEDSLVELVAWTWTEGTFCADDTTIRIFQSWTKNPDNCLSIKLALISLFGEEAAGKFVKFSNVPAWRATIRKTTGMLTFYLNRPASVILSSHMTLPQKVVHSDFISSLTQAQLKLFIDCSVRADGHIGKTVTIGQRVKARTDVFEMACALVGLATNSSQVVDRRERKFKQGSISYVASVMKRNFFEPKLLAAHKSVKNHFRMEIVSYEGLVWCPTTPNGTWLAKRRGTVYYTGNCHDHKGIPRANMPQLVGKPVPGSVADKLSRNKYGEVDGEPAFRAELAKMGIKIESKRVPATNLRASQMELNGGKIAGIVGSMDAGRMKEAPIFVTRDGYIIDGHHRWAANVAVDLRDNHAGDIDMPVEMIDMDIGAALDYSNAFTRLMGLQQAKVTQ